jgi:hypothetical protein
MKGYHFPPEDSGGGVDGVVDAGGVEGSGAGVDVGVGRGSKGVPGGNWSGVTPLS